MLNKAIMSSYRKSSSFKDVFEVLNKSNRATSMMLWQHVDSGRNVFWSQNWKIDKDSERFVVFFNDIENLNILPMLPIYIKLPFREAIFKTNIEAQNENCYFFKIPSEIIWREFREHPRKFFNKQEIEMEVRNSSMTNKNPNNLAIKVWLKDISLEGAGILLNEEHLAKIRAGSIVEIVKLDKDLLLSPKPARVVYIEKNHKRNKNSGHLYRGGLKFLRPLTEDFILSIGKKEEDFHFKSLSIDCFSDEFQEVVEDQVIQTLKKIKKQPSLSQFLKQIELSRNHDLYIEEHIKVLCIVCSFIARSLNWVTDLSLQKLIYVSYLHDTPLLSHPKLTRIRNLKDFEKVKKQLTLEEQSIYLSAPERAFALALADDTAPPDAPQMLLMQKERPDGLGFPRQLNFSKINAMSSIFIVGHDLTDEIMLNKDWSITQWIQKSKSIYRGGHFTKIMDALQTNSYKFRRKEK